VRVVHESSGSTDKSLSERGVVQNWSKWWWWLQMLEKAERKEG